MPGPGSGVINIDPGNVIVVDTNGIPTGVTGQTCINHCNSLAPAGLYPQANQECLNACLQSGGNLFTASDFWEEIFGEERTYNLYGFDYDNTRGTVSETLAKYAQQKKMLSIGIVVFLIVLIIAIIFKYL